MWDVLGCYDPLLSGPVRVVSALPLNERSLHSFGGTTDITAVRGTTGIPVTADALGVPDVTINRLLIALPVPGTGNTQDD
jgi:hypothetical protein